MRDESCILIRDGFNPRTTFVLDDLASSIREHGVLVRHFQLPRIEQFLRISVGTPAQCEALVNALRVLGVVPSP